MRDLTKSILSFSWVMSLFGVQQTANMLSPAKATKAFNHVTEASEQELCGLLKTTFSAGDRLQRGALDLTLGLFTGQTLDPGGFVRTAADVVQQSTNAVMQGVEGVTSTLRQGAAPDAPQGSSAPSNPGGNTSPPRAQGWGPIPS